MRDHRLLTILELLEADEDYRPEDGRRTAWLLAQGVTRVELEELTAWPVLSGGFPKVHEFAGRCRLTGPGRVTLAKLRHPVCLLRMAAEEVEAARGHD